MVEMQELKVMFQRAFLLFVFSLLIFIHSPNGHAAECSPHRVHTQAGNVAVDSIMCDEGEQSAAVIILGGSKGLGAPAYDDIGATLNKAGLDVFLVHVLTSADLEAIANGKDAQTRIAYYAKHLPVWVAVVQGVITRLNAQSRYSNRVGVLGISLGAQIAAAASANRSDIKALVLVDGGFPNGYSKPLRSLPPLQLIWGGADRTFPLSIGQKLLRMAQDLGGRADIKVYEGAAHDFFLRSGTRQALSARRYVAEFLSTQLLP